MPVNVTIAAAQKMRKEERIESMHPEKFTFENLQHRTTNVDFLLRIFYQINNTLRVKKRRVSDRKTCLPILAPQTGHNSNLLIKQLRVLSELMDF